jgi:hypothetical protein
MRPTLLSSLLAAGLMVGCQCQVQKPAEPTTGDAPPPAPVVAPAGGQPVKRQQAASGGPDDVARLTAQLKDADEAVRLKAAKDLGRLKERARPAMEALGRLARSDPDEDVRSVAKRALKAVQVAAPPVDEPGFLIDFAPIAKIEGPHFEHLLEFSGKMANGEPIKLAIIFRDTSITEIRDDIAETLQGFQVRFVEKTKLLVCGFIGTDGKLVPITELTVRGCPPGWPKDCHPAVTKVEPKKK